MCTLYLEKSVTVFTWLLLWICLDTLDLFRDEILRLSKLSKVLFRPINEPGLRHDKQHRQTRAGDLLSCAKRVSTIGRSHLCSSQRCFKLSECGWLNAFGALPGGQVKRCQINCWQKLWLHTYPLYFILAETRGEVPATGSLKSNFKSIEYEMAPGAMKSMKVMKRSLAGGRGRPRGGLRKPSKLAKSAVRPRSKGVVAMRAAKAMRKKAVASSESESSSSPVVKKKKNLYRGPVSSTRSNLTKPFCWRSKSSLKSQTGREL